MCGIAGFIDFGLNSSETIAQKMGAKIQHRGPDSCGSFFENNNSYQIGFAHQRLSIIDLNSGKQPIYSRNNSQVIVFNGEIYNYRSLKAILIKQGVAFDTTSDTEVIMRLYEMYGTDSFSMLDGMFAFSIFDRNLNKLFIARDFFGEKPLYYHHDSLSFSWASELKSIISVLHSKPEMSNEALSLYFQLTY